MGLTLNSKMGSDLSQGELNYEKNNLHPHNARGLQRSEQ